ncbi:MAG: hypothetical protein ACREX9_10715, partial [Gammaproteobacteria bacterium]
HGHLARCLAKLGHEIGLHYDAIFFRSFPRQQWGRFLSMRCLSLPWLGMSTMMWRLRFAAR